jgi:glyoxylase-like metal-dependent hydrolase (beta-lactamase superfamily II)
MSMKLCERIYLVGSGSVGLSDPGDCHVYLIDGGQELALVDAGCGAGAQRILENIRRCGCDRSKIRYLLLTHAHRDHARGCVGVSDPLRRCILIPDHSLPDYYPRLLIPDRPFPDYNSPITNPSPP